MNENDYSITPLSILPNVSGVNSTKDSQHPKKRRKQKKGSKEENADLIEVEDLRFQDDKAIENTDNPLGEHQIDFCA